MRRSSRHCLLDDVHLASRHPKEQGSIMLNSLLRFVPADHSCWFYTLGTTHNQNKISTRQVIACATE